MTGDAHNNHVAKVEKDKSKNNSKSICPRDLKKWESLLKLYYQASTTTLSGNYINNQAVNVLPAVYTPETAALLSLVRILIAGL